MRCNLERLLLARSGHFLALIVMMEAADLRDSDDMIPVVG